MADAPTKLLLVEDERIVRITVRDALVEAGYRVTDLADGATATFPSVPETLHGTARVV